MSNRYLIIRSLNFKAAPYEKSLRERLWLGLWLSLTKRDLDTGRLRPITTFVLELSFHRGYHRKNTSTRASISYTSTTFVLTLLFSFRLTYRCLLFVRGTGRLSSFFGRVIRRVCATRTSTYPSRAQGPCHRERRLHTATSSAGLTTGTVFTGAKRAGFIIIRCCFSSTYPITLLSGSRRGRRSNTSKALHSPFPNIAFGDSEHHTCALSTRHVIINTSIYCSTGASRIHILSM